MHFSEIKDHLSKFTVGIAGAGGLGSNCAIALARSGVGTLVIADYDTIETGNLNRQYYFLRQAGMLKTEALKENIFSIDPVIKVQAHNVRLDPSNIPHIFSCCNIIVEALDSDEMKEMLIEIVQLKMKMIPLVVGSGLAGWGKNETIVCRKIDDTLYICGDETAAVSEGMPPMAPRVAIVANMQANKVIEILMSYE